MDLDNPVVRLCAEGMEAERSGRYDDARALFKEAWDRRRNDYEGCIAAHYLARHQPDAASELRWNLAALALAGGASARDVRGFLASLHLNVAASYAKLGQDAQSRAHLTQAETALGDLAESSYKDVVRRGIRNVARRLEHADKRRDEQASS
jgi:hypothetical protein